VDGYIVDEGLAESLFHDESHRVMGHRLRPFSFWHKLQLEYWNSRVLLGGATLWDVWLFVQICRTQYPKRPRVSRSPFYQMYWWLRYGWIYSLPAQMAKLSAYVKEYSRPPKSWGGLASTYGKLGKAYEQVLPFVKDEAEADEIKGKIMQCSALSSGGNDKERDLDDALEQVALLCRKGHAPAVAWNMPIGELVWLNVAIGIAEGAKVQLWTTRDEMRMETFKKTRIAKIARMADEIAESEGREPDEALAVAAVRYWEDVVEQHVKRGAR
jgi:hypothetical protein